MLLVGVLVAASGCPDDADRDDPSDYVCVPQICGASGTTAAVEVCTKSSNDAAIDCEYRFAGTRYACESCGVTGCASASNAALMACRADPMGDAGAPDAAVVTSCGEAPIVPDSEPPVVSGTGVGAIASYTCSPGYAKMGADPVCGEDMLWSDAPTCTVILCDSPATPTHASMPMLVSSGIAPSVSETSFGASYRWTCDDGYTSGSWTAIGYIFARCEASGWVRYSPGTVGTYRSLECATPQWTTTTDTVIDVATDLEWQRAVSASTFTTLLGTPCGGLVLGTGGGGGWRVPTSNELADLHRKTIANPDLAAGTFLTLPSTGTLWTSTVVAGMNVGLTVSTGVPETSSTPSWSAWCVRTAP